MTTIQIQSIDAIIDRPVIRALGSEAPPWLHVSIEVTIAGARSISEAVADIEAALAGVK